MKIRLLVVFIGIFFTSKALKAQSVTDSTFSDKDTTTRVAEEYRGGILNIDGYADIYYGYHFQNPQPHRNPYFYSSAVSNEFSVNLVYAELDYESYYVKAKFIPAVGTYMEANYAAERPLFRNVFQASGSARLFKDIWLEAGILPSPFGYETAISKDQLTYSRSLSAENSPYYLAGFRLGMPITPKISLSVYGINGWQNIQETNPSKSVATQVQYRMNDALMFNWSAYWGNEQTVDSLKPSYRFFNNFYLFFKKKKWSMVALWDIGRQNINDTAFFWHTANLKIRYHLTPKLAFAGRAEYFSDPHSVMVMPIAPTKGFEVYGYSFNIDYAPDELILFRLETRSLTAKDAIFKKEDQSFSKSALSITASLSVRF